MLLFVLVKITPASFSQADDVVIVVDGSGNLVLNASAGRDVIMNGVSFGELMLRLQTLQIEVQALQQSCSILVNASGSSTTSSIVSVGASSMSITATTPTPSMPTTTTTTSLICTSDTSPLDILTVGGYYFDSTTINGSTYLVVANEFSGSYSALNSTIYKWNPNLLAFLPFQNITTLQAVTTRFFLTNSSLYLMVTNFAAGFPSATSELFVFDSSYPAFKSIQLIPVQSAFGCALFSHGTDMYAMISSIFDGKTYNLTSQFLKFDTSQSKFVLVQNVSTSGGAQVEAFVMQSTTYLALSNSQTDSSSDISSYLLTFDAASDRLTSFQNISTHGCKHLKPFAINADQYLAAANYYNNTAGSLVQSEVFKFNTSMNQFVSIQLLSTTGATAIETFIINGASYLFVSNNVDNAGDYKLNSTVYAWNASSSQFGVYQPIPTVGAAYGRYLTVGSDSFLAVPSNYDGSSYYQPSKIYKWCHNQFVLG